MQDVTEIDLMPIVTALLKKLWLLVLCGILAGCAALLYTRYLVTPMYRASVSVYVNNISKQVDPSNIEYVSGSNLSTSKQLVTTYVNIIRSDRVLSKVVEQSGLDISVDTVRGMMTASSREETEMFDIYVSSPNPEQAAQVANAIAEVAPDQIAAIVEGSSTKIIDYARVPLSPYSPNYQRNVLMGAGVGAVLAAAYVVLRAVLDKRIKTEDDLERLSDLPVLGVIPDFSDAHNKSGGKYDYNSQPSKKGGKS